MDILFRNADIITMCDERPVIRRGFVGVDGGRIVHVGENPPRTREGIRREIDCAGKILMPGLINTHAHTAMCVMRGYADDYRLDEWLYKKIFPVEARLDARAIVAGARLGFAEMLRTGTTFANDMYFIQPKVAELAVDMGIRAALSNAFMAFDESYDPDKDRAISETIALARDYDGAGNGRVKAMASIHAEYTSYARARRYMLELAEKYALDMHIHISETQKEHEECLARNGRTPVQTLYDEGVFARRTVAAHCVYVTPEDMDIMAQNRVSAAHCPVSNLKLASGIADVRKLREHGVNVALGTDGCCSNNTHDLFEEIKLAALLSKGVSLDPTATSAYEALKMATVNGAVAMGVEDELGTIAVGKKADIILIDTDNVVMQPMYEPCAAAAYSASGRDVCMTMVDGRILYENGEFMSVDIEAAKAEVREYAVPLVMGKQEA